MVKTWKPLLLLALALLLTEAAQAAFMGRLFTTPPERQALDEARLHPNEKKGAEQAKKVEEKKRENRYITLNGVVKRSDGPATVWINGQPAFNQGGVPGNVQLPGALDDSVVEYQVPESGEVVYLKPGQTMATSNGDVSEGYSKQKHDWDAAERLKQEEAARRIEEAEQEKNDSGKTRKRSKKKNRSSNQNAQANRPKTDMERSKELEDMLESAAKLKAASDGFKGK